MTNYLYYGDTECGDLHNMYQRFDFDVCYKPQLLSRKVAGDRLNHIKEEMDELTAAVNSDDLPEVADALVDLVVLLKGTAVMMGLPWGSMWDEVHRANTDKVTGINPKRPDHGHDLVKPEGWLPPRIKEILDGSL